MTPLKETNKALLDGLKELIYRLSDKEFGFILLKKFSEL